MDNQKIALLSNITSIICKDLLMDVQAPVTTQHPFLYGGAQNSGRTSVWDDDSDESSDEVFHAFLRQQQKRNGAQNQPPSKKRKKPNAQIDSPPAKQINAQVAKGQDNNEKTTKKPFELNLLNQFDQDEFEQRLHMKKATFLNSFQSLQNCLDKAQFHCDTAPQYAFSLAMWKLTTDEHFEEMSAKFHISRIECQTIIRQFLNVLMENSENFLSKISIIERMKLNEMVTPELERLPHIFGVLVTKRINVFLENLDAEVPVILQIICQANYRIFECYVAVASEYNFDASPIGRKLADRQQNIIADDGYLVGDDTAPLRSYLIQPFGPQDMDECSLEQRKRLCRFNGILATALRYGQGALQCLTNRFNILYALEASNIDEVSSIAHACCILHNFCTGFGDLYAGSDEVLSRKPLDNPSITTKPLLSDDRKYEEGRVRRNELLQIV